MVLIGFSVANDHRVLVHIMPFSYHIELPLFFLVFSSFFLGILISGLIFGVRTYHRYVHQHQMQQHIKALQNELDGIKLEQKLVRS